MKLLIFTLITLSFTLSHAEGDFQDEEILENLTVENLKTKEEIVDYLNSLSEEKLKELHHLRDEIYEEYTDAMFEIGVTQIVGGVLGAWTLGMLPDDFLASRKKAFKFAKYGVGAVFVSGLLIAILYGTKESKGLGLYDQDEKSVQENLKDYINSLTLEEAREVLFDIKKINEDLRERIEANSQ